MFRCIRRSVYPEAVVNHLEEIGSDHTPLILDSDPTRNKSRRRFKFQERWCTDEEVRNIIMEAWKVVVLGSPMFRFFRKLKQCRHSLVDWQRNGNGNWRRRIDNLKQDLASALDQGENYDKERLIALEKELLDAYLFEERYWKEKSRVQWLK